MMNKETKRINCQHCGRVFLRGNNLTRHEAACAKRPSDEVLIDMFERQALPLAEIARLCGVGYKLVRGWLQELGKYAYAPRGPRRAQDQMRPGITKQSAAARLVLRKDLAHPLAFTQHPKCPRRASSSLCRGYEVCAERLRDGFWILCEIPDVEQVKRLEGRGVDIQAIVARVPA